MSGYIACACRDYKYYKEISSKIDSNLRLKPVSSEYTTPAG
jgi:hypothetical protein